MRSDRRRLEKLEGQLTPRQAFLLWLHDAHQFESMIEYAHSLKGGPDSAWPIPRLCHQMYTSVTQGMKGKPPSQVTQMLRQAYRDVLFLFFLHQQVNGNFLQQERYLATQSLMLAQQLAALMRERRYQEDAEWHRYLMAMRLPYPLDPETAQAVDAAWEHQVIPWEELAEDDEVQQWIIDSFLAEGKTALPEDTYRLMANYSGVAPVPNREDILAAFPSDEDFEKYLSGEDYHNYLTDVTDAEFDHRYETMVSVMRDLGMEGTVVELPAVPNGFLRNVSLVDGEWVDRHVVALAEWGSRLQRVGFVLEEVDDAHPLAWWQAMGSDSREPVDAEVSTKIWRQNIQHLDRFPGRKREINGRVYLRWEDYLAWRGRWCKGDLRTARCQGLLVSPWNRWVEEQGDEALLAGVAVGQVYRYEDEYRYQVYVDSVELEQERQRRRSLLDSLWLHRPGSRSAERFLERVRRWREMVGEFLVELYTLREAVKSIDQRYFEEQQAMFPKAAKGLEELMDHTERLVELYNRNLAKDLYRLVLTVPDRDPEDPLESFGLDLSNSIEQAGVAIPVQVASLLDLAKVEVLDALGENRQVVKLLDRYI